MFIRKMPNQTRQQIRGVETPNTRNRRRLVNRVLESIAEEMLTIFKICLDDSSIAMNRKTMTNTLVGSELEKTARVRYKQSNFNEGERSSIFMIYYNDYMQYIESGRRRGAKPIPISALIPWARLRGIPTDNNTLYAIQQSIVKVGIAPRRVMESYTEQMDDLFYNEWSERLFEALTEKLIN